MQDDFDLLFAAPLDRFIEVRDELVRRLKTEGSREEVAAVAAMRKPSVSVWVVNQLAREAGEDLADLALSGEMLETVQRAGLTGGGATGYQDARTQEGAAIARLEKAARRVLPSITAQTLERVLTTLRAGAASADGRALLASGRLRHDLEPTGFEPFAAGFQPPAPKPEVSKSDEVDRLKLEALRTRAGAAAELAVATAADARRAADEADMAERRARKAREDAASATERAQAARAESDRLADQVARAESERASGGGV